LARVLDFALDEELELIARTSADFAAAELTPRLREAEAARSVPADVAKRFAETGLAGLELAEALGGAGQGALARVLVNEELGAADPGAALALDPLGPAFYAIRELGGEEAVRTHAAPLLDAPGARAVLVCEADAALSEANGRVLGTLPWVPADRVDLLVWLGAERALLLRDGIERTPLRGAGLRAAGASELRMGGARVIASWRDAKGAARALARARLYLASLLLGVLREAAEFSRRYALQRVAFGRPIAHHQALAFLIADMRSAVDGARLLVHEAAWHADQALPFETLAAAAFAETIEASTFVGPNGIQILGGHGFMQDYPVEKFAREARALGLLLGGVDHAREQGGRALAATPPPVALSTGERG
jgi:alkylation response protein AidB-like acyl-CoA dehydrogenase